MTKEEYIVQRSLGLNAIFVVKFVVTYRRKKVPHKWVNISSILQKYCYKVLLEDTNTVGGGAKYYNAPFVQHFVTVRIFGVDNTPVVFEQVTREVMRQNPEVFDVRFSMRKE